MSLGQSLHFQTELDELVEGLGVTDGGGDGVVRMARRVGGRFMRSPLVCWDTEFTEGSTESH